mgnify:CR=1 FL=1
MNTSPEPVWKKAVPIICTAVLGLYFGGPPIFSAINDLIQDLFFNDLTQYRAPIQKCIDQKTAAASGTKVLGLDYECAIDIGAVFYAQEPDRAIRLCKKFYPLRSEVGGNDFSQKYEDNLQTSICRFSLESRIHNASSTAR